MLKRLACALLPLLVSLSASAAGIRFQPAVPDNRSWITATLISSWCSPVDPRVTITGNTIDISIENATSGCIAIPFAIPVDAQIGVLAAGVYDVKVTEGPFTRATDTLLVRDTRMFTIAPFGAPAAGGTEVELRRSTGGTWLSSMPAPIAVYFGDAQATLMRDYGDVVRVKVPPHAPGTVDVRVVQTVAGQPIETVARYAFTYFDAAAQPDATIFEPILFPVAYEGAGAFGSQWTTENWVSRGTFFAPPCEGCGTTPEKQSATMRLDRVSAPAGVVLWAARGTLEMFGASSRVRDTTRQADNAGAYVPVARESDFRHYLMFPDVPADPKYRVTLRVWNLVEPQLPAGVKYGWGGETRADVKFTAVPLSPRDGADASDTAFEFGSIDLPLWTMYQPSTYVTVSGARKIWGILSVTNNETQQVTIIAPRPGLAGER